MSRIPAFWAASLVFPRASDDLPVRQLGSQRVRRERGRRVVRALAGRRLGALRPRALG